MQGDYSALDKNQGQYFDTTNIPININDLNDYMFNLENEFNKSDPKLKSYFGNSFGNLVHSLQDNTFDSKYNDYLKNNHPEFIKRREKVKKDFNESVTNIVKEVINEKSQVSK